MVNRRSLGEALSLSPSKVAFIQGTPQAVESVATSVPAPAEAVVQPEERERSEPEAPASDKVDLRSPSTSRRTKARTRVDHETGRTSSGVGMANLLAPLTTRLQPATAAALKRAGLEQRLRGAQPATVQEIAEVAITEWLIDNGYL
ncbi:hypothetical protein [Planctomicrobium sp. SH527]|uniref:hypothetical protein n=1 Tax=Planctomicrobium sp. SH527 TaxID=3448123 RepID=UPI003F5C8477